MFEIVKNVLKKGGYDLNAITRKIKGLWLQGDLTEEQYAELIALAQEGAEVQYSINIVKKIENLEQRIIALEKEDGAKPNVEEAVTVFVEGKWYYTGDKCVWNGKTYTCVAPEGVVCVWSPDVYPAFWEEILNA